MRDIKSDLWEISSTYDGGDGQDGGGEAEEEGDGIVCGDYILSVKFASAMVE